MSSPRRPPVWAWLVAVPLALFGLAWGAVTLLLPPARAAQLVREQLSKSLAREVRFDKVSLSLFPPVRLSVKRLELAEPGGLDHGAAFTSAALDLDLDLLALCAHRVRVRRLLLESPTLHLVLRADGSTNLDGIGSGPAVSGSAPPPGSKAPALDLDLREFGVHAGNVLVDDLRGGHRIAFSVGTRMSVLTEQGGTRIATSGETVLSGLASGPLSATRASDLGQGLARLAWHVKHRGKYDAHTNRLALESLALDFGGTQLALSGLVDSVGQRARFDFKARGANFDVEQLLSWVSAADAKAVKGLSGHGTLAFDLGVRGSAAPGVPPVLTGVAMLKDAAFRYAGAAAAVSGLSLTANFRPDTVWVPDVRASVSGQPLTARLRVWNLADPNVDFAVRGDVDLAAVSPLLAAPATQLGGHADVNVSGTGRAKDPGTLALSGSVQLRNVSVESSGLPRKVEGVNGRIDFLPEHAAIQRLTARAGQSSFTLDGSVRRPLALMADPAKVAPAEVEFAFRSSYLDLAELLPTTPGAPFLPNAIGGGRVTIDRLKQGKLDVTAVSADVKLAPAVLEAPHFAMQGYGGTVSGDARIDLHNTRRPEYGIHATVDRVKADAILSAWTPVRDLVVGTLSTKLELSGAGTLPDDLKHTLTLIGLASLTDGRLGPGPALDVVAEFVKVPKFKQLDFAKLELPMRIEHGRLVTDPVVLNGPSGEWRLAGAIGFDGALDYAVSVTLPAVAVDALGARSALAAGALSDAQGRVLLDLRVSGSARAPRVSWDADAMTARLAGRVSDALAEQRTRLESDARAAARQALLERFGVPRDSTVVAPLTPGAATDTLRTSARTLLKSFFGRPSKPASPPAPVPVPDTTKH